jgi:restriction system protein
MGRNKNSSDKVPSYDKLLIPTLEALKILGGSGSIEEINEKVYVVANLSQDILEVPHDESGLQSQVDYRLAWARTYLKKYGLIENSSRAVWSLIDNDIDTSQLDYSAIIKSVRDENKKATGSSAVSKEKNDLTAEVEAILGWKEQLLKALLEIDPAAFERLCQRLLRESGCVQVEVTGKTGDGGIDGKGIVRISGFLSFHILFQCKRYKGSVSASQIRDFRGAMTGRADKGLLITTGTFTRDALKEAARDGAPPIDLIDGEILCDKLKEYSLGVKTELIEEVSINMEWFQRI